MTQIFTSPLLTFMFITACILLLILAVYLLFKISERASRLYWKRVLAEGARLAREHPEWLAEAVVEHDIVPADTREVAVVRPNRMPVVSVETAPRKVLEGYAHRLEHEYVMKVQELATCNSRVAELEHELDWAMDWKGKHWRRIQRVDEALKSDDGDVFAALHPRLAREHAS